mmetsp:Transcript_15361/g.31881  ORF Transcript_15361/g.31881 Transcript_15361/m.31881 type:complete len:288 (+) Transcript_15361:101-964(+)
MGFLDESRASWLWPLRRTPSRENKAWGGDAETVKKDSERAFDIADSMEKGFARELVADFVQALPDADRLWKFRVERSDDRQHYRLFCDDGDFLLYARLRNAARLVEIFLYDPNEKENKSLCDSDRPAFTLSCTHSADEWLLAQERCDNCRSSAKSHLCGCYGKQELFRVRHSKMNIGDGINHCMDVELPPEGSLMAWGQDAKQKHKQRILTTRAPAWNDEVSSLVLDFKGRQILASAKNFQLSEDSSPDNVLCQYGKLGTNSFGLDFKYPLNVVQAFGISLTTLLWS